MTVFQSGFVWMRRHYVGGALALDLCNTSLYHRWPERRRDRIAAAADLERWWAAAAACGAEPGLPLAPAAGFAVTAPAFRDAMLLRDLARRIFAGVADGAAAESRALDALMGLSGRLLQAMAIVEGRFGLAPDRDHCLPGLLCASAVGLLWRGPLDRLRACPNCDWLFLDRSRNRSRKWCDMETCGNRAKAERFARRRGGARPCGAGAG